MFLWGTRDCCGEVVSFGTFLTSVCITLSVCDTLFDCGDTCITARLFSSLIGQALVCFGVWFGVSLCFGTLWKEKCKKIIMQ